MKLTFALTLIACLELHAKGFSQQTVTISVKNATLADVLRRITNQTDYHFLYNVYLLPKCDPVTLDLHNAPVEKALDACIRPPLSYVIVESTIIIKEKPHVNKLSPPVSEQELVAEPVKGKVINESGEPLAGATVQVKDQNTATVTAADGSFAINLPDNAKTIVISFVGMEPREMEVVPGQLVSVTLSQSLNQQEEVVLVGYGRQKKINLTGSVDAIKGSEISSRPVTRPAQALQGLSPGTTVINRGGAPGVDDATILIRGIGTFGNNNPLIVLDGVPVGSMFNVNAADIEDISILKDAASAAIYGSRSANGVILITTKRGKAKPVKVSYSGYTGVQSLTRAPKWVSTEDYMMLVNEASVNAGKAPKYSEEAIQNTINKTDIYRYPDTDWWGIMFRNALQHKHSVSVSGGSDKVRTAISAFYLDQQGILIRTNSQMFGLRANNDISITSNLDMNLDLSLTSHERNAPSRIDNVYWNLLHDVPPTIVAKYPDGTYQLGPTNNNPLAAAEQSGNERVNNYQGILTGAVNWKPMKGLKLSGRYSINQKFDVSKKFFNKYEFKDYFTKTTLLTWHNSLEQSAPNETYTNLQVTGDYEITRGEHQAHLLLGYSQEKDTYRNLYAVRREFYSNNLQDLVAGSVIDMGNTGNTTEWGIRSLFGRLNYTLSDKYLFEANFRYDGSSRFASGSRWGFFPSFSAGYKVSQEEFWDALRGTINEFKIRASWGRLGNQDIALYQYIQTVALGLNYSFGGQVANGAGQQVLANKEISWESSEAKNLGIDLWFLNNRFTVTADFYDRLTTDILLSRDIPLTVGLLAPVQNVGAVRNTGWELTLKYIESFSKDFKISAGFNISDVKNRIRKYGQPSVGWWTITKEGESIDALFGYVTDGLFQSDDEVTAHAFQSTSTGAGDLKYLDQNHDGIINELDKVVLGSTLPRYTYGINFNVQFRNWDLNLFFNGVGKCNGYQEGAFIEGPIWDGFTTKEMLNRWTPDNRDATWPRLVYQTIHNQEPSDYWIQRTSFFRFKNFLLGYTFPQNWTSKAGMSSARVYVSGENVLTFTKAKNLDPEYPSGRATYYPQTKIYSVGLDISF